MRCSFDPSRHIYQHVPAWWCLIVIERIDGSRELSPKGRLSFRSTVPTLFPVHWVKWANFTSSSPRIALAGPDPSWHPFFRRERNKKRWNLWGIQRLFSSSPLLHHNREMQDYIALHKSVYIQTHTHTQQSLESGNFWTYFDGQRRRIVEPREL